MQQEANQTIDPYAVLYHVKQLLERIKRTNNRNQLNPPMETKINFNKNYLIQFIYTPQLHFRVHTYIFHYNYIMVKYN